MTRNVALPCGRSGLLLGLLALVALLSATASGQESFCGDLCPFRSINFSGAINSEPLPVVALGSNFIVGVPDYQSRGAILIYSTNSLLRFFTNNTSINFGDFGYAVAVMDGARFIVGAPRNNATFGSAYLYQWPAAGGIQVLLATIINPVPQVSAFGSAVAAVGSNWMVVGAPNFDAGTATSAGAVYLFSTNGALVSSITNPAPQRSDRFGSAIASLGADRFLVGAPLDDSGTATNGGTVYLYSTNGSLLKTIREPVPRKDDQFGTSIAEVGTGWFAVGAIGAANVSATTTNLGAGAVYLYNSSGTLLRVIQNPFPGPGLDGFGRSISRLGQDRLLITAPYDADFPARPDYGTVYVCDLTTGALLARITNPDPEDNKYEEFAVSVTSLGNDRFVVSQNPPEIPGPASVHIYDVSQPQYALGQEIPPPPNFPLIDLVESGPEIDPPGAAFWHRPTPYEARLYATKAGQITIRWKTVNNDVVTVRALNYWPPAASAYQLHVVQTPPVDLSEGGYYTWTGLMDHEPTTGADERDVQVSRHFAAQGPGRSLLMLSPGNPLEDAIHFQLVRSITWDDLNYLHDYDPRTPGQQDVPFNIGEEILDLNFHNTALGAPFVFWENSFYNADPGFYDRAQRTGPIFAVNRDQPAVTDDMLVIYYTNSTTLKDAVSGSVLTSAIAWPWKPVRYECDWPSNATPIVIADHTNRPVLSDQIYVAWDLYVQNDPSKPGFNPNDEHALKLPYSDGESIFPLRDDLGTANTSQPFVLIKYFDGTNDFKPKMRVFSVAAGAFNYPMFAAQLIQPPFPLNLFQRAPESTAVSGPYFRDRKLDFWGKAAGDNGGTANIVMRFFYPIQDGFYFPSNYFLNFPGNNIPKTNLPPAGTRFPWLDLRAGTPKVPHDINYTVQWPAAPELNVGETLVKPKKGLPDISSQTSVELVYQQAQALDSSKTSVVLIDPTRERELTLSALPNGIETIKRGDKHFFPKLPPQLRERLFWDDTEDKLNLKGEFVQPTLGESYLLLNLLTTREKQLVSSLYPTLAGAVNSLPSSLIEIGPGSTVFDSLALTAGNAEGEGYVTLAFGNNPALSPPAEPVSLAVIRVVCPLYVGEIKVVESENPFDEKLTLRHSGDFAGKSDRYQFEWKYARPGPDGNPPSRDQIINTGFLFVPSPSSGHGAIDITIEGPGLLTLADNYFVCRYRATNQLTAPCGTNWTDWTGVMLAEGWIKRVLKGINPFEQRFKTYQDHQINTLVSMIGQAGPRYEGDVPLSLSAAQQFGLIEIYETVLRRGIMLSIGFGIDEPAANNAILLAAGRLADLYMLLGNEAYADAADPTIGFGTDDGVYGSEATSIHCFMNQTASLLEEELVLLRGRDDSKLPSVRTLPIYNRLAWNFTRDINGGEVAYALNYNIRDENGNVDGTIDEADAKKLYPQGHGDAWGHYLAAIKYYYRLLTHPNFTWIPRTEAVLLGGAPVEVDYLDERKFARAAASKARAGAEIVILNYRQSYSETPGTTAPDYSDDDPARAWGMADWASRAGQGALIDWVVANAMLPQTSTNTGIKKVDRTTVTELREIPAALDEIQSKIDMADAGLNPLGLARNAVPFDISPAEIDRGNTHFEQIFNRAQLAMNNAITVFNHAHNSTQLLRRQADNLADFQITVQEREFDFKNRLIELFGYPYSDDIGPAGTYPAGYDGPDIYHFDYYDPSELVGFTPAALQTLTLQMRELDVDEDGKLKEENHPVAFHISTEGLGLIKPPTWSGKRRAAGEIQIARSELVQTKARFERAMLEYDNLIAQIEDQARLLEVQHNVNAEEINILNTSRTNQTKLNEMIRASREQQLGYRKDARVATLIADAIAEALPQSVGLASDLTSVARSALKLIGATLAESSTRDADNESQTELRHDQSKEDNRSLSDIQVTTLKNDHLIVQQVAQLEQLVRQEIPLRVEIFTLRETLRQASGRYLASLARGERLLEDRLRFRQQTAAKVQAYRYKDMAFRIFRNDAIQKYRAQFDLAAMYVYLAGKAYDFEACLPEDDIFGAPFFLTDIIRTRSLGLIANGQPMIASGWGDPGLADPLAWMGLYWNLVLDGSFENPQTETGRFSLRSELFRIVPGEQGNATWRETLSRHVVPHFPDLPEVKRYCVLPYPLQSSEPAIVIPFSTTINFGLNYFGWPLGGGDNAYNSTHSATKIRSAGVWFGNYNNLVGSGLANTPQVYLIPIGSDMMRSGPDEFGVRRGREWKVLDQKLPMPFRFNSRVLNDNPNWIPFNDTVLEEQAQIRQFQSFRAYHDSGMFDEDETISNSRLIGRSVWNSRWLLIIPAGALYADRQEGLQRFIYGPLINGQRTGQGVSDIKIFFQTYSY